MKNSTGYCPYSIPFLRLGRVLIVAFILVLALQNEAIAQVTQEGFTELRRDTVPEPRDVMRQSMVIPGWGQVTNEQRWKVPIIYGLFAGVVTYGVYSHRMYTGYRAAFYNSFPENTDLRFGPTPSFVPAGQPPEIYRFNRNQFRNRRDLTFVGILLVYGLNIADAYIFAQLRDFDVSDDLSAHFDYLPHPYYGTPQPVFTVTLHF